MLPLTVRGHIIGLRGNLLIARLPLSRIGDQVSWQGSSHQMHRGQIVSFAGEDVFIAPFDSLEGVSPGTVIESQGEKVSCHVGEGQLGKVVNAFGEVMGEDLQVNFKAESIYNVPPDCLHRSRIDSVFTTGVRVIDHFLTLGIGQRVGLFASAGIGKSTLLGMIAKRSIADVNVIALIGERRREVKEFIEDILGEEGLSRSIVVVSSSDEPAICRRIAAYTATTIAEYFRDQGKNVLFLLDSLTRTARAIRDMTLAAGELPVRHGYTPSVYTELPNLLERAGHSEKGSITALYSVLTNNEDDLDPLGDEVKSLLDGHIVLSAKVANEGIWPAIDPLKSVSRLFPKLRTADERSAIKQILKLLNRLQRDKELILMGGVPDAELECALKWEQSINAFRNQDMQERCCSVEDSKKILKLSNEICFDLASDTGGAEAP